LNPRPLGYDPYDVRLCRLGRSPVAVLASADSRLVVVPGLLRLPQFTLSRRVRFTNWFTEVVLDLRVSVLLTGAKRTLQPVGSSRHRRGHWVNPVQASAGCRYSFVPVVVRGCCCTFLLYLGAAPAPTGVTSWLQMLMDGRGRVWLARMVPVRVPAGGCSSRTPPSCKSFRRRSLMWLR
jgi:hypothetical protein